MLKDVCGRLYVPLGRHVNNFRCVRVCIYVCVCVCVCVMFTPCSRQVQEIFGPVLVVYVYPEKEWESTLRLINDTSPCGLTGSVFARN